MLLSARILPTLGLTVVSTFALIVPAQAQNTITITGGNGVGITVGNPFTLVTPQGTGVVNLEGFNNFRNDSCPGSCHGGAIGFYSQVNGSGFSPTGPVVFSGVGVFLGLDSTTNPVLNVMGGIFNAIPSDTNNALDASFYLPATRVATPDFSSAAFSFEPFSTAAAPTTAAQPTLTPPTTSDLTTPEPLTEPGGFGDDERRPEPEALFSDPDNLQQRAFRPNGVHTRVFPFWTPGLYQ